MFDEDSINAIVELLTQLPEQCIGKALDIRSEITVAPRTLSDEDDFAHCTLVRLPGGLDRECEIRASNSALVLRDVETRGVLRDIDISAIEGVEVRYHRKRPCRLVVWMEGRRRAKFRLSPGELDAVLANLIHTAIVREGQSEIILPLLLSPDFAAKIFGFETEADLTYGTSVVQELVELAGKPFDGRVQQLLFTLAMNPRLAGYDAKLLGCLAGLLAEYLTVVAKAEQDCDPATGRNKAYDEFIDMPSAERAKRDPNGNLLETTRADIGATLQNSYARLAPLLCTMRSVFAARNVAPDLPTYLNLVEILLRTSRGKNSVVAYLASACIRAMLKASTEIAQTSVGEPEH